MCCSSARTPDGKSLEERDSEPSAAPFGEHETAAAHCVQQESQSSTSQAFVLLYLRIIQVSIICFSFLRPHFRTYTIVYYWDLCDRPT